ncbi:MAG: glycosyltransferase family 2 protein [Desulfobacteraceae bacterium]|nr:glycosyltransferase family 2 protein [Desulfobacteraceae bacterium]
MSPQISVVILCYRAGRAVMKFVEDAIVCLDKEIDSWQIVLVGNYLQGATDITPQVVREIAKNDDRIKAVTKIKEGMMGWDVRSGFVEATGDVIALIDGDGQMTFGDVIRAYRVLQKERCDIVTTYRAERYDGRYRFFVSRIYNLIFHMLFRGLRVRDINSKPKLITRNAYNRLDLKSNDWFIDAEIMIQARRFRLKVSEIPVIFYDLKTRRSFVRIPAILEFIKNLILERIKEFIAR